MADNKDVRSDHISRVNRVTDYVRSNLNQDLSLEFLSKKAALSKFHFHRVFRDVCGETPSAYVKRIRVESSAFSLIFDPKIALTSVAYDFGFSSSAVYSRAFRTRYGMSPTQWREAWNQENEQKCETNSNSGQTNSNSCKALGRPLFYLNPKNGVPLWRVHLSDSGSIDINVETIEEINVAYIRHHGPYDAGDRDFFVSLFSKLFAWAIPRGEFDPDTSTAITAFSSGHPHITDQSNLTVDACISIKAKTKVSGLVGKRKIASGRYAVVELVDATLNECRQAWDLVFDHWIHQSGYRFGPGDFYCTHSSDLEPHPKLYNVKMFFSVVPQGS